MKLKWVIFCQTCGRQYKELKAFAAETGLDYVTNDDSMTRDFNAPPVIVNYFYHEQIKKSARKDSDSHAGIAGS